ncbi:MAG TPA: hypothetical protein VEF89_14300 [Solirubrobacteraceae bacterium]|nr:hypothetical protein [Solirubrobacteraceae bacterium]
MFVLYGAPLALASSAILVYRAVESLVPLALGAIGVAGLRRAPRLLGAPLRVGGDRARDRRTRLSGLPGLFQAFSAGRWRSHDWTAAPGHHPAPADCSSALAELRSRLEGSGLHSEADEEACAERLEELRRSCEPYAIAISRHLALELPDWLPKGEVRAEWPTAAEHAT